MAQTKQLARSTIFEVSDGAETPVWLVLDYVDYSPNMPKTYFDQSTQADGGRKSEVGVQLQDVLTVNAIYKTDPTDGTRDPAQARCETLSRTLGAAGVGRFRITDANGDRIAFDANFNCTPQAGGQTDGAKWSVEVRSTGNNETVDNIEDDEEPEA